MSTRTVLLGLLVLVCCAGIFVLVVEVIRNAAPETKRLELYYKGAQRFSEEQKALYLKGIAGFWAFDLEKIAGGMLVSKKDRLEIKENGIVWQAVEWKMTMPDSTRTVLTQIRTVYINPYGISRGDTLSDAYVLSQAFFGGEDTCFGGYNYSELWQMARRGGDLVLSKRNYRPYRGALAVFFPAGAVDLVERSEKQLYYDTIAGGVRETKLNSVNYIRKTDAGTGKVSLLPIRDSITGLDGYFRLFLEGRWGKMQVGIHDENDAAVLLEKYHQPFIVDEQWRLFPRPLPRKVRVYFIIMADGRVDSVRLLYSSEKINAMFISDLTAQVASWRFPAHHASSIRVSHTFTMPH
ncbi:MAG: hypothetical protein JXA71_20510 [Chitinispirillaceae bacterium]|nr:hypothetical protein [Chitinispirillaceae bacterium]